MLTREQRVQEAVNLAEMKMNVSALAPRLEVTRQSIYAWKRGENSKLTGKSLVELAELSGLNARWIINGKGPKYDLSDDDKLLLEGFSVSDEGQRREWLIIARDRINSAATKTKTA